MLPSRSGFKPSPTSAPVAIEPVNFVDPRALLAVSAGVAVHFELQVALVALAHFYFSLSAIYHRQAAAGNYAVYFVTICPPGPSCTQSFHVRSSGSGSSRGVQPREGRGGALTNSYHGAMVQLPRKRVQKCKQSIL